MMDRAASRWAAAWAGLVLAGCSTPRAAPPPDPTAADPGAPNSHGQWVPLQVRCVAPAEVGVGDPFELRVLITNTSRRPVGPVAVALRAEAGLALGPMRADGGTPVPIILGLGPLAAGETRAVGVPATATREAPALSGWATAGWGPPAAVVVRAGRPGLTASGSVMGRSVLNCDPAVTLEAVVSNPGVGPARGVRIAGRLPAGLTTADGRTAFDEPVGDLPGGASRGYLIALRPGKTGRFPIEAVATAEGDLRAPFAAGEAVVVRPEITITGVAPAGPILLGREAAFTFTVRNTGDGPSAETTVTAGFPEGATFRSADKGGTASGRTVAWRLGDLPPGEERTVTLSVSPGAAGPVPVAASAVGRCAAASSTVLQAVCVGVPAILLEASDDPDPVQVGSRTTYSITVTNQGTADLTAVVVACTLDDAALMQYVSSSGNGVANGQTVTFPAIPALRPGEKHTFTLTVKAVGEGQGQLRAEARAREITRPPLKAETTTFTR